MPGQRGYNGVHLPSNFLTRGYASFVTVASGRLGPSLVADIGSAPLESELLLPMSPTPQSRCAVGAALVTASHDKVLGDTPPGVLSTPAV
ncbi:hypothetical protein [Catellatospora tritici]|uniref:hypothetical protein n=1 Tax=Catellatospora tritici TaxID=2851566 RepID=UPI001C2CD910|nr:hypothetical protein [Catellatospora tritici]MBV1854385.1 hypothetical protein [Catellatospora tritici]